MKILGSWSRRMDVDLNEKLGLAAKAIEVHRNGIAGLRTKLEVKERILLEESLRAHDQGEVEKASEYAKEHSELRKVLNAVISGEVALNRVVIRLESIMDMGDLILRMSSAFKILNKVSRYISGMQPALTNAVEEVNGNLNGMLNGLESFSLGFSINTASDEVDDLVRRARDYAEERALGVYEDLTGPFLPAQKNSFFKQAEDLARLPVGSEDSSRTFLLNAAKREEMFEQT